MAPVGPVSGPVPFMTGFVESEISVNSNFLLSLANIGKAGV